MEYNVFCTACGRVWKPAFDSPLWWQSKRKAQQGYLDALPASAQECGCEAKLPETNPPFRVFGYDMCCEDFDVPCWSFIEAVITYLKYWRVAGTIIIKGVSDKVVRKLEDLSYNPNFDVELL